MARREIHTVTYACDRCKAEITTEGTRDIALEREWHHVTIVKGSSANHDSFHPGSEWLLCSSCTVAARAFLRGAPLQPRGSI
jgi:hypothetical protein